jgi:hypothetical protein
MRMRTAAQQKKRKELGCYETEKEMPVGKEDAQGTAVASTVRRDRAFV